MDLETGAVSPSRSKTRTRGSDDQSRHADRSRGADRGRGTRQRRPRRGRADKGYHSNQELVDLEAVGVRSYISEPTAGGATGKTIAQLAMPSTGIVGGFAGREANGCCATRRTAERPFAHLYETAGTTRASPRSHEHPQTRLADGRVESRAPDAHAVWRGHAAEPPGSRGSAYLLRVVPHSAPRTLWDVVRTPTANVACDLTAHREDRPLALALDTVFTTHLALRLTIHAQQLSGRDQGRPEEERLGNGLEGRSLDLDRSAL